MRVIGILKNEIKGVACSNSLVKTDNWQGSWTEQGVGGCPLDLKLLKEKEPAIYEKYKHGKKIRAVRYKKIVEE